MEQKVPSFLLPEGDRSLPVDGLIFFQYHGKPQSLRDKGMGMVYEGPAGTLSAPTTVAEVQCALEAAQEVDDVLLIGHVQLTEAFNDAVRLAMPAAMLHDCLYQVRRSSIV